MTADPIPENDTSTLARLKGRATFESPDGRRGGPCLTTLDGDADRQAERRNQHQEGLLPDV